MKRLLLIPFLLLAACGEAAVPHKMPTPDEAVDQVEHLRAEVCAEIAQLPNLCQPVTIAKTACTSGEALTTLYVRLRQAQKALAALETRE